MIVGPETVFEHAGKRLRTTDVKIMLDGVDYRSFPPSWGKPFKADTVAGWMDFFAVDLTSDGRDYIRTLDGKIVHARKTGEIKVFAMDGTELSDAYVKVNNGG